MPPFRPPQERINYLADKLVAAIQSKPNLNMAKPEEVKAIFRVILTQNLKEEHELELEAEKMLRAHGQQILKENADFHAMLKKGKEMLAKKKGFHL